MYKAASGINLRNFARTALLLVTVVLIPAGCSVNPATGDRQLALISEGQEIELGRSSAQQAEQSLGLVQDAALQEYVANIGLRLAAQSERPDLPWRFAVIDDATPNAFALPGGFIYVTRGMLSIMNSEAELASVLGHEIGHVTARHSVAALSRSQLASLGLGLGSILVPELRPFGDLASAGMELMMLKYGRDAERQADELGFRYALDQDYAMQEMAQVFKALQRSGEMAGRSPIPSWAASHPAEQERINAVNERVAALPADKLNGRAGKAEYYRAVDGLVYGENPRHGYFSDGTFYHPDLKFQFSVPADWKTQNMTSAVLALSAAQDAKLQFSLAAGSADEAARKFLAQQSVQSGGSSRETINGIPAVVSQFRVQSQQGNLQGYVAHYSYSGSTYELLLYTPQERFGGYDRTFRQMMGSFGPVTDRAVLDVQPMRLDVVSLDRAMTFQEFTSRYPSPVKFDELTLINHIENPNNQLARGTLLKRVTGTPR